MRRIARLALLAAAAALLAAPALAGGMRVDLDQVRTITFRAPIATVYVGNPAIADINMIDSRHAFILGKSYGTTNLIALNAHGVSVANEQITVMGNQGSTVTLNRGAERVTYDCAAGRCEPTPTPGDSTKAFGDISQQIAAHQDANKKAAGAQ
jgi:hypothetical protein